MQASVSNDAASESLDQRSKRYQRVRRRLGIARFVLNAGFLVGLLFAGWSVSLRDLAWRSAENVWLAVLVYVLLLEGISNLLGLPLRFYSGYVLEHRYDLSNMRLAGWVKDLLKSLALGAAFGIPAVEVLYYTLRRFPDAWWLLCWALLSLFSILMTNLAPVLLFPLFYKFQSVTDENLRSRLLKLSERAGARVRDVIRKRDGIARDVTRR